MQRTGLAVFRAIARPNPKCISPAISTHLRPFSSTNTSLQAQDEQSGMFERFKLVVRRVFRLEPVAPPPPPPVDTDADGLDWSEEVEYRRQVGPLATPDYEEIQPAGNSLTGQEKGPVGLPESTAKINVLKDALPSPTAPPGQPATAAEEDT